MGRLHAAHLAVRDEVELVGVLLGRDIDDGEALQDTDLRRREADARSVVHRLDHIVDEFLYIGCEFLNRACPLTKNRTTVSCNWSDHY